MLLVISLCLAVVYLLAFTCVCHALLTKSDPRSALGWCAMLILVPGLGLCLYVLFGISRTQRTAAAFLREHPDLHPSDSRPPLAEKPDNLPVTMLQMEQLGRSLTHQYPCGGNSLEPLFNGNEAYPRMLKAVEEAKSHVFLVTYILKNGKISRQFQEALMAAADRGVDVRVILDGIGRLYTLRSPLAELQAHGVRAALFLPPRLFPPSLSINLRNHRKILVCDDTAFTGGMNIADYHVIGLVSPDKTAQDVHFRCRGPIVAELRRNFLADWRFAAGEDSSPLPEIPEDREEGPCFCRSIPDGPGSGTYILSDLLCGSISTATRRVWIMTPYFLPTREIMGALRSAAQKGVDVRVVLPQKNNLFYVHWAQMRVLPTLLRAGVRVFFQPAPFAHTKLLCLDDYYCQIGSANMDSRSLRLNFELNTEVYGRDFSRTMREFMEKTMEKSREESFDLLERLPLPKKLLSAGCWLFSPYL